MPNPLTMPNWRFNVLVTTLVVMTICLTLIFMRLQRDAVDVQPRDVAAKVDTVDEKVTAVDSKVVNLNKDIAELRLAVNHAKELAEKNEQIQIALNEKIEALKRELEVRNGKD